MMRRVAVVLWIVGLGAGGVSGTAFLNPDGSVGNTGPFTFTPGPCTAGSPRPLPAVVIPKAIQLRMDGGLLAGGTQGIGTIPATGPGARMMWHPAKAAFRAGSVFSTGWDEAGVGRYSVALGFNPSATGLASVALGEGARALNHHSTAMGWHSLASGSRSTAFGEATEASGHASTAMGGGTTASGANSTAMGLRTIASGTASIAIGEDSQASGNHSFAGVYGIARGHRSVALGLSEVLAGADGSFVWGDTSDSTRAVADQPNQFVVRAAGGVRMATNAAQTSGVVMFNGANAWSALSDRNMKTHVRALDGEEVLTKLAAMPVTEWSYTTQDVSIRHVGRMAQDFQAAFGLGEDALRISTIDADGIALAGVKALEARTRAQSDRIEHLERQLAAALAAISELKARKP